MQKNANNNNNDTQLQLFREIQNEHNSYYVINLNKEGNLLIAGDFDGNMFLYDNLRLIKTYKYHSKFIITLEFSISGKYLASGSADCNIGIIEFNGNKQIQFRSLSHHSAYVMRVDFSPNEHYLITAGSDKQVLVFNSQSCELLSKYQFPFGLNCVQFISETKLVIYGYYGNVKVNHFPYIMKSEKNKQLQYQIKQVSVINCLSNSLLFLINGIIKSQIYLINLINFKILRRFITQTQKDVIHLHLANSKAIFTTSENVEVLDWITARLLHVLDSSTRIGTSLISEDGMYLYVVSRNTIKIWVFKN